MKRARNDEEGVGGEGRGATLLPVEKKSKEDLGTADARSGPPRKHVEGSRLGNLLQSPKGLTPKGILEWILPPYSLEKFYRWV